MNREQIFLQSDTESINAALITNMGIPARMPELILGDKTFFSVQFIDGSLIPVYPKIDDGSTLTLSLAAPRNQLKGHFILEFEGAETAPISVISGNAIVENALNALPTIIAAGGVTVDGGPNVAYKITFNTAGSRSNITIRGASDFRGGTPYNVNQIAGDATTASEQFCILQIYTIAKSKDFALDATNSAYTMSLDLAVVEAQTYLGKLESVAVFAEIKEARSDGTYVTWYTGTARLWNRTFDNANFPSGANFDALEIVAAAENARDAALAAQTGAETAATNAASSAQAAQDSATNASRSATDALAASNDARIYSQQAAASANSAQTSATNAANSEAQTAGKLEQINEAVADGLESITEAIDPDGLIHKLQIRSANVGEIDVVSGRLQSILPSPIQSLPMSLCFTIPHGIRFVNGACWLLSGIPSNNDSFKIMLFTAYDEGRESIIIQMYGEGLNGGSIIWQTYDIRNLKDTRSHTLVLNVFNETDTDERQKIELFLDGKLWTPTRRTGRVNPPVFGSTTGSIYIGSATNGVNIAFNSPISRYKIFNRTLDLTTSDGSYSVSDYNQGVDQPARDNSCIFDLSDEKLGEQILDKSTSQVDMTCNGDVRTQKILDFGVMRETRFFITAFLQDFIRDRGLPIDIEATPILLADQNCDVVLKNFAGDTLANLTLVANVPQLVNPLIIRDGELSLTPSVAGVTIKTNLKLRRF